MLPLRQAKNTAGLLQTSPLRQGLPYLPPQAEVMLDLRMLPLLSPEITVFATETLTAKQNTPQTEEYFGGVPTSYR